MVNFIDLTTSSADTAPAFEEFLDRLSAQKPSDFYNTMASDFAVNAARIKALEEIINKPDFDARLATAAIVMLTKRYWSSKPVICSSVANARAIKDAHFRDEGKILHYSQTERSDFIFHAQGRSLIFLNKYKSPDRLTSYDFMSFVTNSTDLSEPDFILSHPVAYIDYKLLSALNEAGESEQFKSSLAKIISLTAHDFLHAGLNLERPYYVKARSLGKEKPYPIDFPPNKKSMRLASTLYSSQSSREGFVPEEVLVFALNSLIFDRIKRSGFARDLAQAANEVIRILENVKDKNHNNQEVIHPANQCAQLVRILVSNYVDRDLLDTNPANWARDLLTKKAGEIHEVLRLSGENATAPGVEMGVKDYTAKLCTALIHDLSKSGQLDIVKAMLANVEKLEKAFRIR